MRTAETMTFSIAFHGPFRVSTGDAGEGTNDTIDVRNALPSTSLKGRMRATAAQLLGEHADIVQQVFGSNRYESPWRWRNAVPEGGSWQEPKAAARVRIDPERHAADPDMLGISQQTGARTATFTISLRGRLAPDALLTHKRVLAISAQATRSLGANRRRGLGWISITCTNHTLDPDDVRAFLALRQA